jgi:hypothetical protein
MPRSCGWGARSCLPVQEAAHRRSATRCRSPRLSSTSSGFQSFPSRSRSDRSSDASSDYALSSSVSIVSGTSREFPISLNSAASPWRNGAQHWLRCITPIFAPMHCALAAFRIPNSRPASWDRLSRIYQSFTMSGCLLSELYILKF